MSPTRKRSKKSLSLAAVPAAVEVGAGRAAVAQVAAVVVGAQNRPRSSRTIGRNTLQSYGKEWSVGTNKLMTISPISCTRERAGGEGLILRQEFPFVL